MKVGENPRAQSFYSGMKAGKVQDEQSGRLRKQINDLQKRLQTLAEDEGMSAEEKLSNTKELQKQLDELNAQLKQRQIQKMQEDVKKDTKGTFDTTDTYISRRPGKRKVIQTATMQNILSADMSMKQAGIMQSSKTQMKSEANILEAQIKQDKMSGAPTERKEAELAEFRERADKLDSQIFEAVSDVNEQLRSSDEEDINEEKDQTKKKAGDEDTKTNNKPGINPSAKDTGSNNVNNDKITGSTDKE